MSSRNRQALEQLVKEWAQNHSSGYNIADYELTEEALSRTAGYLTWVVKEGHANIDLVSLVDRIQDLVDRQSTHRNPDGMYCKKCNDFVEFAEPNQSDGSMICYSCRTIP